MLHSLPLLLDELEHRLMAGEDPLPLLASVKWPEVVNWPESREEALSLRRRLGRIRALIQGLQAPLQATLMGLNQNASYHARGAMPLPGNLSLGFEGSI